MSHLIKSTGPHTWPIIHEYHRCEKCGTIIESREAYEYRMGKYQKDLTCPKCEHAFTLTKNCPPSLGPLFNSNS